MRNLTLSLVIAILVATVGLSWLFDQAYEQYYSQENQQNSNAVSTVEQFGLALAKTLNELSDRERFIEQWQITNGSSVLAEGQSLVPLFQIEIIAMEKFPLPEQLLSSVKQGEPLLLETETAVAFHYFLPADNELLIVKSPIFQSNNENNSKNYLITTLFYFILILAFLLWAYPLVSRLIKLSTTAKAFGQGQFERRISLSSFSYIGEIEAEFNAMAQRIENLINDVKLLSSAVSHDLRTPLARIRFGIDTLAEEDDPRLRQKYISKIGGNIDEMTDLVNTLLNYARLEQAMLVLNKDKVEFSTLVSKAIDRASSHSNNELLDISFNANQESKWLSGDKSYLIILINNLLQNAIYYGKGRVIISLIAKEKHLQFDISDNGAGITTSLQNNIFKPFVRGDNSHQNSKGYGIGLAMVKRIVDWHQGEVIISKCPQLSGALFTVKFPV